MPATLVWGKGFETRLTKLPGGSSYEEVFGNDGGSAGISWTSVRALQAAATKYGIEPDMWPIYEDCDVDSDVPLDEAILLSSKIRESLMAIPSADNLNEDTWLSRVFLLLKQGYDIFIMT